MSVDQTEPNELKKVFLCSDGKGSFEVYDLGNDQFVNVRDVFKNKTKKYETKDDAQYASFVNSIRSGTPVKNFRGSKYYKMYIQRAKKDYPEFLLM